MGKFFVPSDHSQWEPYRPVITQLYAEQNRTLKEVQFIMEHQHAFKASKHMYIDKFKVWKINKQYKASEKQQIVKKILQACLDEDPSAAKRLLQGTVQGRPIQLRKIWRYLAASERDSNTTCRKRLGRARVMAEQVSPRLEDSAGSDGHDDTSRPTATLISMSRPSSNYPVSPSTPEALELRTKPGLSTTFVPMAIYSVKSDANLELVLSYINIFLQNTALPPNSDQQGLSISLSTRTHGSLSNSCFYPTEERSTFFNAVGSAIYFLKVNESELAINLLKSAGNSAWTSMPLADIEFLLGILAILSPTNTRHHPSIRNMILEYLYRLCTLNFGDNHPLTMLCHELQLDLADSSEIPIRSLAFMLDSFDSFQRTQAKEKFQIQKALTSLYRRGGNLEAARDICKRALTYCRSTFGENSEEACQAKMELVYIYTYYNEYDKGIRLCAEVLQRSEVRLGPAYPDCRASSSMENMAELHHRKGDVRGCLHWLREALLASWRTRGGVAETIHIRNKLDAIAVAEDYPGECAALEGMNPILATVE